MIQFYDTFPTHFFIEMCYGRKNDFGVIYEQNIPHKDFKTLCEAYGVFNGCYELAVEIMNYAYKCCENEDYSFTFKVDNSSFINNIKITIVAGQISSFDTTNSKIINNKFNPLSLRIGIQCIENNQKALIMHELTHAYEDYKRNINNTQSLNTKAKNIGYYKNPISMTPFYNIVKKRVSYILYHLTDFERNAYIAAIKGLFMDTDIKFRDINQALQYVKQTIIYKNYQQIFDVGEMLCNETNKENQKEILYYVNTLSNNNFTTYNQFVKWLSNRILKFQKKFNKIIPKIAAEYFNMVETYNAPINYLINI